MPTQNRRVATYLPKELDDRLKAFIAERNLKGDSPALIAILSEYFEVAHSVSQRVDYSDFVRVEEFQGLLARVDELSSRIENGSSSSGLLSRLPDKMRQLAERLEKVEASTALRPLQKDIEPAEQPAVSPIAPGQMDLLPLHVDSSVDNGALVETQEGSSSSSKPKGGLVPMNGYSLSKRFGLSQMAVGNNKNTSKGSPEKFTAWTKKKDPDGIAWRYDQTDRLYHPIVDDSLVTHGELPI